MAEKLGQDLLGNGVHTGLNNSEDFTVFDVLWKLLDT